MIDIDYYKTIAGYEGVTFEMKIALRDLITDVEREQDKSNLVEAPVMQKIADIIDKEIEIQKKIEKHIEQVETGERLRQMRLISQSKRIAHEEIKKELLNNFSA